ncbi:hypothetical protein PG985_006203 [Apiospora marii]|uniref:Uncharacterized protein n=1 Tax=Apiospora marii TaxID=335849 RepID=A0ABR1S730_9PEZI
MTALLEVSLSWLFQNFKHDCSSARIRTRRCPRLLLTGKQAAVGRGSAHRTSVFGGIPVAKTSVEAADFDIQDDGQALLKGGFHYGVTRRGVPYIPPRPLLNHGPHRAPLEAGLLKAKATREQVADAVVGKVAGWGQWVGSCERKWT